MRRTFSVAVFLLSLCQQAYSGTWIPSHSRLPGEAWEESFSRYERERRIFGLHPHPLVNAALPRRESFDDLDLEQVPEWKSLRELTKVFKRIRDLRHLQTTQEPDFLRRISWLFPDDGCFARAAMARRQIEDQWGHRLAKLYSFGNLRVSTKNSPNGSVRWSWHIVPAAKVDGELYVIDPAIEPLRPLTAREWALRQVEAIEDAKFALCNSYSYDPWGKCWDATEASEEDADKDQQRYLRAEKKRLEKLGRNPERELGEFPPWRTLLRNSFP